jgi:hypothetical protein
VMNVRSSKHVTLCEYSSDSRCRQCVNAWRKVKKYCDSCKCTVQWGSWRDHLKSKKHRMNSYVDQPINSTEEYIKCGVCNSFAHRSSFDGTDRCNLCKIHRNSSKKHCNICDCDVVSSGSSKHCKTKKHLSNMSNSF